MKKFLILMICLTIAFFAQVAYAADVPTTFGWQDDNPVANIGSWEVFRATASAGPWTMVKNIPYYDKGAATEWQTIAAITVPDNAVTTVFFKAQTVGKNGLRSPDSNIISEPYDTRVLPIAPKNLIIKGK